MKPITTAWYGERARGIGATDIPELVAVGVEALSLLAEDHARRAHGDNLDLLRAAHKEWEATARGYADATTAEAQLLLPDQQTMLAAQLMGLVNDCVVLFIPLYRIRDTLACEVGKARDRERAGRPSTGGGPYRDDVRFWAGTGRGRSRLLRERLSRAQLAHLAGLLDDALRWADRLELLECQIGGDDLNSVAEARTDWAALMLERFRRMRYLFDAAWLRMRPIECIVDRLIEKRPRSQRYGSGRDRTPPPPLPPLMVDRPIRRSTSI